ncbi:DNA replication complex subunit Gins51 [Natronorarus salvus]|uniref:DNA replication complex subunit Gins51 n=1 Tax=Natronorarus salvus TaxID=3117733 RepID=UPI002F26D4CC
MNLDDLQSVRDTERRKDSLQHLEASFYGDVAQYIEGLREERSTVAEASSDPFADPEVRRLTDEIETAEGTVEAIYERRVGKLVKLASFAAADMPADEEGLTREERQLFEDLVDQIKENRRHVLSVLAGEADGGDAEAVSDGPEVGSEPAEPTPEPADAASKPASTDPDVSAADLMGGAEPTPTEGDPERSSGRADGSRAGATGEREGEATGSDTERRTVRITEDIGEIVGFDARTYTLAADDVVTLPVENAEPLVEREAAEPLD